MENLDSIIEAVLFASGEPIEAEKLCDALDIGISEVAAALEQLAQKYARGGGIELLKLNNAYQLVTKKELADHVKSVLEIKRSTALSPAAMEALTVVAYNQPVTKGFVESVRGVDSSGVVNSLVEKGLLCEAGRLDLPGRPIAYKTTDNFLRSFGLSSLTDLPELPEQSGQITIDEILENANNAEDELTQADE